MDPARRVWAFGALAALALALAGCGGKPYEVAEVDGVLLLGDKPASDIRIEFVPDPDRGTPGPPSTAETDAEGRFHLQLLEPSGSRPGAVVGWHRVVLNDMKLAKSETGQGVEIRLDDAVTSLGSTKLEQEVKPGRQTIEIRVDARK